MPFSRATSASLVAFSLFLAAPLARPAAGAEVIDRILVRVNSRIITQSLLDARVDQAIHDAGAPPDEKHLHDLKKGLVEELVNEALLEERAKDLDLFTNDAEIDDQIKRLKEQNNVTSDEEFERGLAASGLNLERLRDQLRKTLTVQRVVGREVNSKVDLSDDALRIVYEREKESWRVPEQAHVAEILVPPGEDGPSRAGAARKAKDAMLRLKEGAKFEDVSKDFSEGTTRVRGGDLGTVGKGDLAPEIDKVVFSLPAGSHSDPILTKSGWHIVKVIEHFPVSYRPFSDVKAEILKKEQDTQFQRKLAEYLEKLKRDAVIRVAPEAEAFYTPPAVVAPAKAPSTEPPAPKPAKKG